MRRTISVNRAYKVPNGFKDQESSTATDTRLTKDKGTMPAKFVRKRKATGGRGVTELLTLGASQSSRHELIQCVMCEV